LSITWASERIRHEKREVVGRNVDVTLEKNPSVGLDLAHYPGITQS